MSSELTDSPERLRLGIDLDGVVADFNAGWIARHNRETGSDLHPRQVTSWDRLHGIAGFETMDDFWRWARGTAGATASVFRDLPPMSGAVEALRELAERHRIVILTARFDWAIPDTLAWLADHRVIAREVHFLVDKHRVPCDVYLDDAPHQVAAMIAARPESTVCRAVRAWNVPVPGAVDVEDWSAFVSVVNGVGGPDPGALSVEGRHAELQGHR